MHLSLWPTPFNVFITGMDVSGSTTIATLNEVIDYTIHMFLKHTDCQYMESALHCIAKGKICKSCFVLQHDFCPSENGHFHIKIWMPWTFSTALLLHFCVVVRIGIKCKWGNKFQLKIVTHHNESRMWSKWAQIFCLPATALLQVAIWAFPKMGFAPVKILELILRYKNPSLQRHSLDCACQGGEGSSSSSLSLQKIT